MEEEASCVCCVSGIGCWSTASRRCRSMSAASCADIHIPLASVASSPGTNATPLAVTKNSLVCTSAPGWKATDVSGTMHPPCRTFLGRSSTRRSSAARDDGAEEVEVEEDMQRATAEGIR